MVAFSLPGSARLHNLQQILSHRVEPQRCQEVFNLAANPEQHLCTIRVSPGVTLFDQNVHIRVEGLIKHSKVTLQAWSFTEWRRKEVLFLSHGHFYADQDGVVDLDRDPSLGGTYTGVDPMGLFWSLKPLPSDPQHVRCVIKDVEKLFEMKLAVFPGHITPSHQTVTMETVLPLGTTVVHRSPKAADVKRMEIEEGQVRGTLFLPPGEGPHPGVIDMFGAAGGLMEIRASLMASHGFVTFALAFFRYKDLPRTETELQFDYFEEAVEWFSKHPSVGRGGIGVVGTSSGGTQGLLMAIQCPQVKAVVNINGPPFRMVNNIYRRGELFVKAQQPNHETLIVTDVGPISKTAFPVTMVVVVVVWKSSAHILCISCDDDKTVDPKWAEQLRDLYPIDKRHLIDVVVYPGAGHLLEPPYTPLCRLCHTTMTELPVFWGGIARPHATAQMDAWHRTLAFLRDSVVDK
ncbi:hypothetical protein BaRGS_00031308 [Batillaria attramentaria]|uniref:Uncharacterized protein n=1 Tax=Batillaria attramentaria TaxID=370345 RepID=A0ABD0JR57_9CAEN